MKVLLRKFQGTYYVWKNARWENYTYYITCDDGSEIEVDQTNIIAIKDDNRTGHVVCQNCGKLIQNDTESIEAHYEEEEAKKDCFKCKHMTPSSNKTILESSGEKNIDGTYLVKQTYVAELLCRANYWTYKIDDPSVSHVCVHNACRRNGVSSINDIFVQHPGCFEKFLTVDVLIGKHFEKGEYRKGYFEYDLKCRGTLQACVNEMGVVDHFRLSHRGYRCNLYYSDKYDMLFYDKGTAYSTGTPWGFSDKKMDQAKAKIAALYKEANK